MTAQKNFQLVLTASLSVFLAITVIIGTNNNLANQSPVNVSATDDQEEVLVAQASLENTGEVEEEVVLEKTDFTKKLIQFEIDTNQTQKNEIVESVGGTLIENIDGETWLIEVPEESLANVEDELEQNDSVANAETDYAVGFLNNPDWGVVRIQADRVWEDSTASGVVIAVIDTGVDSSHLEFGGRVTAGYDFYNNDTDPSDDHGHGTVVSGIAAAGANGSGTIGVGPQSVIMPMKVLGADGYGYVSDVVSGINWAVENGASVINMSLGTTYDSSILKSAVDNAASSGVVMIAAAGNTGGSLTYPAAYDSVMAVGATDANDNLASFSARGSEVVAPGVGITAPYPGGGYVKVSGTSASSPHVAGVAAHLIGQNASNIRQTIREGTEDLGDEGVDIYFGYGIVNVPHALGMSEEDIDKPVVEFVTPKNGQNLLGQSASIIINATDDTKLEKVDLVVNGEWVYSSAAVSFQWRWNLVDTITGRYILEAKAYDSAGNVGTAMIEVQVSGGKSLPTTELPQQATNSGRSNIPDNAQENKDQHVPTNNGVPSPSIDKQPANNGNNSSGSNNKVQGGQPESPGNSSQNSQVRGASTSAPGLILFNFLQNLFGK